MRHLYCKEWLESYSTDEFEKQYTYEAGDLGVTISGDVVMIKCWSPYAKSVILNIYPNGNPETEVSETVKMEAQERGTWSAKLSVNDYIGKYYDFLITFEQDGTEVQVTSCDPYACATGVNGEKSMILDLTKTNPAGWEQDRNPNETLDWNDMVIYELHVRDFSASEYSGIQNKGKFLGVAETGTKVSDISTGLDHLKDMGITHLHLLPFYDYGSIDETQPYDKDKYNWGYDPKNYNTPEGSYATDAYDGSVRVKELKEMVSALHKNGISVVMDVVYNHTYNEEYCFNRLVPGYFYRIDKDGVCSDGTACGNDTASERSMVRKFIVESVLYWAREYHIDGFRFDLLGILDVDTMNEIRKGLDEIRPNILLYGEGWTLNTVLTKESVTLATQQHVDEMDRVAMFSDNIRDAVKGSVFEEEETGFISGNVECVEDVKTALMGAPEWASRPEQVVNYTSCHDNYTLFDKIALCNEDISFENRVKQNKLAAAIVLLSQGIPLLHAGEEILRSKVNAEGKFVGDSYKSSDDVNAIRWEDLLKPEYQEVYEYYKGLIVFRKNTKALHIKDAEEIKKAYTFIETEEPLLIGVQVSHEEESIVMYFNGSENDITVTLPDEGVGYQCYINACKAGATALSNTVEETAVVAGKSCLVLKR